MSTQSRPPVVTVMGHVDHGKTSLLDAIRHSKITAGESGGITQHIGAYQVDHEGRKITWIDTPGHAAFTKMRSRGAQVTDIVVLVVSATEGVKPQTVESIQHIKSANVAYLVAITKMDLPEANPEMVKAQLAEHEVYAEGYGGDVVVVPVSARSGDGLPALMEMILLTADMKELTGDPEAPLNAVVIESRLDTHRGSIASVIVREGTLRVGDSIHAGTIDAKVRSLVNDTGKTVNEAGLSMPVEIIGWESVPEVGIQVLSGKAAEAVHIQKERTFEHQDDKKQIKLLLKSDVAGTLEAIEQSLTEEIELVGRGIGEIGEHDVLLAEATGARIYGFRVKIPSSVAKLAETHGVKIKTYTIIYDLLEDLQKQVLKLIEPTIDEEELGVAQIVALFEMKGDKIAGCKVKSGEITRTQLYHLRRDGVIYADPKIASLKRGKDDIEVAKMGTECGVVFRRFGEFQIGDELVAFRVKDE
ncbi:MAG: Translation initiation factor IF-2 [Microgenomates group bacterium GW2011_GWF2_45_18]|nr:MAG: Translation initiation factor IF-2 [Microgenomates group bacterium GW2011_GWF1_44_10]KKU01935.1 MAG: Translation initiation factor IF-2 [Microgenomates group bacterium GW2011_GWF2_45_18]OGJ41461.1 MAG: translation initiation factor IF-2 [Candidatus Pacebacteria bacterium RIFOXYB1_FULL_44_10]HAU98751.1 translation initiation factor IF-2 [Candidatus Paceibacterota bacterium]HAX01429.1 translation initiation factor IF-2 [Candidatus Paceibacterota bacterium]